MSGSPVRERRRRRRHRSGRSSGASPEVDAALAGLSPPPAPSAPTVGADIEIVATPGSPTGRTVRLSHRVAGLLVRLPLLERIERRLAPVVDQGRLDRTDALAGLVRYGAMGATATLVYFVLAVGIDGAGAGPTVTSAVAIGVSVLVSFVAQSRITFQSGPLDGGEAARFGVVGVIGFTISRLVIDVVHVRADQPFWMAALLVCLIVPVANFAAMNFWVFNRDRSVDR